jgi:hypothetical protein
VAWAAAPLHDPKPKGRRQAQVLNIKLLKNMALGVMRLLRQANRELAALQ